MSDLTRQQERELKDLMEDARKKAIEALQEERVDNINGEEVKRMVYTCTVAEAQAIGAKAAAKVSQEYKQNLEAEKAEGALKKDAEKREEEKKESEKAEKERKKRNEEIREGKEEVIPDKKDVKDDIPEDTESNKPAEEPEDEPLEDFGIEPEQEDEPEDLVDVPKVQKGRKKGRKK